MILREQTNIFAH